MSIANEVYSANVQSLPPRERLRLASLILDDLASLSRFPPDFSDAWSEEDVADLRQFSLKHAELSYPPDDDSL